MDKYVDKIKKSANEIKKTQNELRAQTTINEDDSFIVAEIFKIPLKDDATLLQMDSLSKAVNVERNLLTEQIKDNQAKTDETNRKVDEYYDELENNIDLFEKMAKTTDLVDITSEIENTKKLINELKEIKLMLNTDSSKNSERTHKEHKFDSYVIDPEYEKQRKQLEEQYTNETDPKEKEKIWKLGKLLDLEYSLDLSNGDQKIRQLGGKCGDIRKENKKEKEKGSLESYHAHHIPALAISADKLKDKKGNKLPGINLTETDHRKTDSYGGIDAKPDQTVYDIVGLKMPHDSKSDREIVTAQINDGNDVRVFRDGLFEIKDKFGDNYDGGIKQFIDGAREYIQKNGGLKAKGDE